MYDRTATIVTLAGNGTSAPDGDGAPVGDGGLAGAAFLAPWGVGLVSAPDGSVVFTDFARIRIVGAPPIARPAVAITGVRTTRERHVVEYRTTVASSMRVVLRSQDGHTVAARRATAPAGRGELALTTPIPSQTYGESRSATVSGDRGSASAKART